MVISSPGRASGAPMPVLTLIGQPAENLAICTSPDLQTGFVRYAAVMGASCGMYVARGG
jgi:hypothetical protein